jgi:hypothetical protein
MWRHLRARLWLRVLGLVIPLLFGLLIAPGVAGASEPGAGLPHPLTLAVILLVGIASGMLARSWSAVVLVPLALLVGLVASGSLSAFDATVWWPVVGWVNEFFLALVLLLAPAAVGAAVGTALDISLEHAR